MSNTLARGLLAMPPTLRHFVLQTTLTRCCNRPITTSIPSAPIDESELLLATPVIPLSYLPTPSNLPDQRAYPSVPPPTATLAAANDLFTAQRHRFLYIAPRFLNVPVNTYMPEVCILGRSNVGKSTLLNALAGRTSAAAGRLHGNASKRAGLAQTSAKAGCTTTMNAYGFGPPLVVTPEQQRARREAEEAAAAKTQGQKATWSRTTGRTEKRAERKRREKPPAHSLIVMDMPGYGLHSKTEWGTEIAKYLERRAMLRGAVLLVDSVAGIKEGDRMALGLLRDANVRTAVVLTKADKLGYGLGAGANEVRRMCLSVWDELRAAEQRSLTWVEGTGWEPEIWITGAGDPKNGGVGVEGARLAICRLAGLVRDPRNLTFKGDAPSSGKVISFDELFAQAAAAAGQPTNA